MRSDLNKFRMALEATVTDLDASIRRRDEIVIEGSADALDRLLGAAEREVAVRNLELVSVRRREVRAALHRIENGTYGICVECEDPIAPARLTAMPAAALCIRCQEKSDCRRGATKARTVFAMAA